jgi:PAS domain S-box-containing protein
LAAALLALAAVLWMLIRFASKRKAAEMRWRTLVEGTAEGVAVVTRDGVHMEVNEAYAGLIGRNIQECRNLPISSALHPDERDKVTDILTRKTKGERGIPSAFETALLGPDGGRVEVAVSVHEFPERPGSWVMVVRDVTEEAERRSRLRRERNLLGRIFSVIQDGLALIDKQMRVRFVNRRMHEMSRRNLGEPCFEVLYARQEKCPWCPFDKVILGETITVEAESRGVAVEATLAPFANPDGTTSVLEVLHDVSERQRVEEARREALARVSLLLDAADLLHSAGDEYEVVEELLRLSGRVLGESDLAVYTFDEARGEVRAMAAAAPTGLSVRRLRRDRVRTEDDPLLGRAIHLGRPEVVPDISAAAPTLAGRYRQWGYSGAAAYPLVGRTGTLGVLLVLRRAMDWPSSERFDLLSGVLAYATSALEQARVFAGAGRRARDLGILRSLTHGLSGLFTPDQIADTLSRWALRFAEPMIAAVISERDGGFVVRAVASRSAEQAKAFSEASFPTGGMISEAISDGRTVLTDELGSIPVVPTPRPVESVLVVPFPTFENGLSAFLIVSDFEPIALGEVRPTFEVAVEIASAALLVAGHHDRLMRQSLADVRPQESLDAVSRVIASGLRVPLTSIRGYISALHDKLGAPDAEPLFSSIERTLGSIESLTIGVSELIDLERSDDKPEIVEVGDILEQVVSELSPRIDKLGVELIVPDELPSVFAVRLHVLVVLRVFLDNALAFIGDNPKPRVEVISLRTGQHVRIEVTDTGVGLSPSDWERVFDPFVRADVLPGVAGCGIGLAAARRAARASGGEVGVTSPRIEEDEEDLYPGSTFWVAFPSSAPRVAWETESNSTASAES